MNKKIIWVRSKCKDYYRFINKVQYLNIVILDIKYENNYVYLKIEDKYLDKLNKYLVSYKFEIVNVTGIYEVINKLKKNYIFVICLVLGICLSLILSNLVVKINVIHENKEIRDIIQDELEEYGITVLSFKKSYDELKKEIGFQEKEISVSSISLMESKRVGAKLIYTPIYVKRLK